MTEQEKIAFLTQIIKELYQITSELEQVFPEKSFKLDGILVGNIVEILTSQAYGITLYKQSEKTHDGEVAGKKVRIKGTQGKDSIVIREEPEYLDKETGTIRVNKLLELDANVPEEKRIHAIIPIKKYVKSSVAAKTNETAKKQTKRKPGKTLVEGYINRNNQVNKGCLNKPGNHANQMAYLLHCNECDFTVKDISEIIYTQRKRGWYLHGAPFVVYVGDFCTNSDFHRF